MTQLIIYQYILLMFWHHDTGYHEIIFLFLYDDANVTYAM